LAQDKRELKKFDQASFKMQFVWTMDLLKKTIGVSKKHLRKAQEIREQEIFEDEIIEKGKEVKRTFTFGFRRFLIKEEHKKREILAPHPKVQMILKAINKWLEKASVPHPNAFGFIKKSNPKKAVETLIRVKDFPLLRYKHYVKLDISQAFPSIGLEMIREALVRLGVDEALVNPLAWFCTYYYDFQRRLPPGSACSPILLNLVYQPMYDEFARVCEPLGIAFAGYADDFTFASVNEIPQATIEKLMLVPAKFGFELNKRKIRNNRGKDIPHILGLTIVEGKIHLKRQVKNKFRRIFYAALKFDAYSSERINGVVGEIRQIYGEEKDWPGWLRKPYKRYQKERRR